MKGSTRTPTPGDRAHNLYWCTTPGNGDDAFIVAATEQDAEFVIIDSLGVERDEVQAEFVCDLRDAMGADDINIGYVSDDVLQRCAEFVRRIDSCRITYMGARCFAEGLLDFVMDESMNRLTPEQRRSLGFGD